MVTKLGFDPPLRNLPQTGETGEEAARLEDPSPIAWSSRPHCAPSFKFVTNMDEGVSSVNLARSTFLADLVA